jgi:CheY-like chemotaxis protein
VGQRVLIADGNVDAAESLALLLRLQGHEVVTAHTGAEALVAAQTFQPDAAFLAMYLPGLDGCEVCRRLCDGAAGHRPRTLVALTGCGQDTDRKATRAAGFDHHIIKPADPNTILGLLH